MVRAPRLDIGYSTVPKSGLKAKLHAYWGHISKIYVFRNLTFVFFFTKNASLDLLGAEPTFDGFHPRDLNAVELSPAQAHNTLITAEILRLYFIAHPIDPADAKDTKD